MYCRKCGSEMPDNAVKCDNCGYEEEIRQRSQQVINRRFCSHCGSEVNPDAVICFSCGCEIRKVENNSHYTESKTGMGVLMALFLGLIGLAIGLALYPKDTNARRTFLSGFGATYIIAFIISIFIIILYGVYLSY